MLLKRLWLTIPLALILFLAHSPATSSHTEAQTVENDAPYIYHYSDRYEAFVIERADGTDRHIFGEGIINYDDHRFVDFNGNLFESTFTSNDYGWSPSGEWYAGEIGRVITVGGVPSGESIKPFIINPTTGQRLTLLDSYQSAQIKWSPNRDIAMISAHREEWLPENEHTLYNNELLVRYIYRDLLLIDVPRNTLIVSVKFKQLASEFDYFSSYFRITWSPDGKYCIVSMATDEPNSNNRVFYIFDKNAHINQYTRENVVSYDIPNSTQIAYFDDGVLVIEDLTTNEQQYFDFVENEQYLDFEWSPSGDLALISSQENGLWFLSLTDNTLTQIDSVTSSNKGFWRFDRPETWSPLEQYVLIWDSVNEELYQMDTQTQELHLVTVELKDAMQIYWDWMNDNQVVIGDTSNYFLVDLESQHIETLPYTLNRYGSSIFTSNFAINSHASMIFFIYEGPISYDILNNISYSVRPDTRSFRADYGGEVYLSVDEQWLTIAENDFTAGGSANAGRHISIMSIDGNVRRDIGYFNWLPDQVNFQTFRAVPSAQPHQILRGDTWIFWLDWSPSGNQLLSSTQELWEGYAGDITQWDLPTSTAQIIFKDVSETQRATWQLNGKNEYEVILVEYRGYQEWSAFEFSDISPRGQLIVINQNPNPIVLDAQTEEMIFEFDISHWFLDANFSPDGQYFAGGTIYENVQIWDTETWEVVAEIPYPSATVAWSPDGTQIAIAASWDVEIWDVTELIEAYQYLP